MKLELTLQETQALLECINTTIQHSQNAINAAARLLPIVQKLTAAQDQPPAGD